MNLVLTNLRGTFSKRKEQRQNDQDGQERQGTLTNFQGLITGKSLHNNDNRAYVGFGASIDLNGNATYTQVVSAMLPSTSVNTQVGSPVRVKYNRAEKRWFVIGMDAVRVEQSGASIQRYNPANVNNKFLDSGFILDFLSRPVISVNDETEVFVKPGVLYYNGQRYEYDGGKIDLASYAPSTSGYHRIAQLWYDPSTNGIQVTTSTEQLIATAFDSTDWAETLVGTSGWMPLQSYELFDDSDTRINHGNLLRDNRPIYTISGGSSASNLATRFEPLTNGNVSSPELLFLDGDVIMMEVAA